MELGEGIELVAPDDEVAVRGYDVRDSIGLLNLILLRLIQIIAQVHAFDIDIETGSIVEFYPIVALEKVIDKDSVSSAHLVDADGRDALLGQFALGERGEGGGEVDGALGQ